MGDQLPQPPVSADEQVFFDTLEAQGEASVRADLATSRWGARTRDVQKWLALKEQRRAAEEANTAMRVANATEEAAKAAARSASAAEAATAEARRSANHARAAWIVAILGVVATIALGIWRK
jgi:hypothetical protein